MTGPGAGSPVDRNGPNNGGSALAITSVSVSPSVKAIMAGAVSGTITVRCGTASPTRITKVNIYVSGDFAASGPPNKALNVNIYRFNLRSNTLLKAVAYDASGNKLSFATIIVPVFRVPGWLSGLFGAFVGGDAVNYGGSYSWSMDIGSGGTPQLPVDKLPIAVVLKSSAGASFTMTPSSGSVALQGSGKWSLTIKSPKGDQNATVSLSVTSTLGMETVSGGYYTIQMQSLTITAKGSVHIELPQLTWKWDWWFVHAKIVVAVDGSISLSARFPYSLNKKLFGLPVWADKISITGSVGASLGLEASIPGIKAGCDATATLSGGFWWQPDAKFGIDTPTFKLELECKGCLDTWLGDVCKSVTVFEITCSFSGCSKRKREVEQLDLKGATVLPLYQDPKYLVANADTLIITGLRPVPSVSFVSIPGLLDSIVWRGVENGTSRPQYASCFPGVAGGCWYNGIAKAPFLSGPTASFHVVSRLKDSNVTVLVAVSPVVAGLDVAPWDWRMQLVTATMDATNGVWSSWTPMQPLWPDQETFFLDSRPLLSTDGSMLVWVRMAETSSSLMSATRSAAGVWSVPELVQQVEGAISIHAFDSAPSGEAFLLYQASDTEFNSCVYSAAGVWTCSMNDFSGVGSLAVTWSDVVGGFVVSYADLYLNMTVNTYSSAGTLQSVQGIPVGYVANAIAATDTPFGVVIVWSQGGTNIIYAVLGTDGTLQYSVASNVSASNLGGIILTMSVGWTGDGVTATGMATRPAPAAEYEGYVFAQRLSVSPDAALGQVTVTAPSSWTGSLVLSAEVGNLGLMPFVGTGASVRFSLVSASGSVTVLGTAALPALLRSGESRNVTMTWTPTAGASGVVRVELLGTSGPAANNMATTLPTLVAIDPESIAVNTPSQRTFVSATITSLGIAAAPVTVQVWTAQPGQHTDDAVLLTSVPLNLVRGYSGTVSIGLTPAQAAGLGTYLRFAVVWQATDGPVTIAASGSYVAASPYDFVVDLAALQLLSIDHTTLRVGLPVLNQGVATAVNVPVSASQVTEDGTLIKLLTTTYVASIGPGGNVSVLVGFTTTTSGSVQIQFEVNPEISGRRLLPEVFTHDNVASRTFLTRAPADGASWSSSAGGHGGPSFASATRPHSLGAASGGWTANTANAHGNAAPAISAASSSGVSQTKSAAIAAEASSTGSMSSAGASSSSSSSSSAPSTGSALPAEAYQSSSSSSSDTSPPLSPYEILEITRSANAPRLLLSGASTAVSYVAYVPSAGVTDVKFTLNGSPLSATASATSYFVTLPDDLSESAVLQATAVDASGAAVAQASHVVPVVALPPWLVSMQETISQSPVDNSWNVTAQWDTVIKGGNFAALSGTSLADVSVSLADAPVTLSVYIDSRGVAYLRGNASMAVRLQQSSGQLSPPAALSVLVTGNITLEDGMGESQFISAILNSVSVTISGNVTFAIPEATFAVTASVAGANPPLPALPLHVSLTLAPNVTFVLGRSASTTVLGGLPLESALDGAPLDFGASLTVSASSWHTRLLSDACAASAPVRSAVTWSTSRGLVFGPASSVLSLSCPVCADFFAGRQCTSAPLALYSWSLLRASPSTDIAAPKWVAPPADYAAVAQANTQIATRFRYRTAAAATPSVCLAQSHGSDLLVWSDASLALMYTYRSTAMPWPENAATAIPLAPYTTLLQPTLASQPASKVSFVLVAASPSGLVQLTFDGSEWSAPSIAVPPQSGLLDTEPRLSANGQQLFFRRTGAEFSQLLSAERTPDGKWRLPKVVLFDASALASYSFAVSPFDSSALLAYHSYGSAALSLCSLQDNTWHCTEGARTAASSAVVHNGINYVLLYAASGVLSADTLTSNAATRFTSSAPLTCNSTLLFDLSAVRSTIAGGHSVLAAWRRSANAGDFDMALVVEERGRVVVLGRRASVGDGNPVASVQLAWTTSGFVAAASVQAATSPYVTVSVLPYTAKLALLSAQLDPPGALTAASNLTVVVQSVGASTYDVRVEAKELGLSLRNGATEQYTQLAPMKLNFTTLESGATVQLSSMVAAAAAASGGALVISTSATSQGSLSIPLCTVSLSNAAVRTVASALFGAVQLLAPGQCDFTVRLSIWASQDSASAPMIEIAAVQAPLSPNMAVNVSVPLVAPQLLGSHLEFRLRAASDSDDSLLAVARAELPSPLFDFAVLATSVDSATTAGVMALVAVKNFGRGFASSVLVEAQLQGASGEWTTVAATQAHLVPLGKTAVRLAVPFSTPSAQVRFRVNGDAQYPEGMWFDNTALHTLVRVPDTTFTPQTSPPRPPHAPAVHKNKTPMSLGALIGISVGGALLGLLLALAVFYAVSRRQHAQAAAQRPGHFTQLND